MNESQRISDHSHLLSYVKKFTSVHWGQTFVTDLLATSTTEDGFINIPNLNLKIISKDFFNNSKLVIQFFIAIFLIIYLVDFRKN